MARDGSPTSEAEPTMKPAAKEEQNEPSIVDQDELWKDVTPIPQADAERAMVQIAYTPEYRKAMNLCRAILAKNEFSERALNLTTLILQYNLAHYTVWHYRSQILKNLHQSDPDGQHIQKELTMLNKNMGHMRKSYQAWQHRAWMVELLQDVSNEIEFVDQVLKADPKNYHTWTYRQTLLCRYNQPEMWAGELPTIERLIEEDIFNNSAWNHRFFVVFDSFPLRTPSISGDEFSAIVDRELIFAQDQLLKAPNNASAWNYLRGVLKRGMRPLSSVESFVIPLTKSKHELDQAVEGEWPQGLNPQATLPAASALELLADIYAESSSTSQQALDLYAFLADKIDPIRKGYWTYRSQKVLANNQEGKQEGVTV